MRFARSKPTRFAVAGGHVDAVATNPGNAKPYRAARTDRLAAAIQKAQQSAEWKDLAKVSQLDGFQGSDAFRAQRLKDRQEVEAVKKKLGL